MTVLTLSDLRSCAPDGARDDARPAVAGSACGRGAPPPVTAHAVLRYLVRVEGFDLRPIVRRLGRDAGNWPLAKAAAEEFGVPLEAIQRRICPPHLDSAVRGGAAIVRREGLVLHCKNGLVLTVTESGSPRKRRIMTKIEGKKGAQRLWRRAK